MSEQNINAKLVALTFDDGPDAVKTPRVIEKLEKYDIKATFMLVGQFVTEKTKDVLRRMVKNGYEFGNHSWTWESLDELSGETVRKYITDTNAAIKNYTGWEPKFFRPPNLAYNDDVLKIAGLPAVCGVIAKDWDSCKTDAATRARNILDGVHDGSIILMHDVQPDPHPTPEALDIIIPALKEQGYEFVTLTDLFKRKNKDPFAYKGLINGAD